MSLFNRANILLPKADVPLETWSVVACDQYTSEEDYWERVAASVALKASTYHMIFPEIYLEEGNPDAHISSINRTMQDYLQQGIFEEYPDSLLYVVRTFLDGSVRRGIMGTVDLEAYDYHKGSTSAIRATEGTVLERIPPRVKVREHALLELPHILMLLDDESRTLIEGISLTDAKKVYDFEMMENGGRIEGYLISNRCCDEFLAKLLAYEDLRRNVIGEDAVIFAVGDGNHSLATAKACWEAKKVALDPSLLEEHPARFALVELGNLYDGPDVFEPIHRVIFDTEPALLRAAFEAYAAPYLREAGIPLTFCSGSDEVQYFLSLPEGMIAVGLLQSFLDEYLQGAAGRIDYIHGAAVVRSLSSVATSAGFILPPFAVSDLFISVQKNGALPRKTFSMGEAEQKRFYLECRKITED